MIPDISKFIRDVWQYNPVIILLLAGGLAIDRRHMRRGEGLAPVALGLGLAILEIAVIHRAILLPGGLPRLLVERQDELEIAPVKMLSASIQLIFFIISIHSLF